MRLTCLAWVASRAIERANANEASDGQEKAGPEAGFPVTHGYQRTPDWRSAAAV